MTSKSPVRSCEDVDEAALSYAEVKALATGNPYIKEKMDLDIQVSKLKLMKANHTSQKYRLEDNITQHYPHQIAVYKERIEGFTADMEKYAKNKPEDKEQFFMQVGGKPYTDKKEAGTAIIAMCKEIKGINASADVGEYLGFKLNVTFDSFNNKFVMNVKGAMSHPMEVGSDPLGNITRINNVLEAMPTQLEEAQTKLSNVEHQLETAKAEVDKPFPQEAELSEKLERLAELNSLLNMDEKGDDAIGMDDEAAEPEKPQETVKTVDNKRDEVADMPAKQSNLGKTAMGGKLSDRPAGRQGCPGHLQEGMQRIRQRKKKKFYRKIYFIPKFIPNLSALFGLGILKSVIAVYVMAVRSGCFLSYKMEVVYGRQQYRKTACAGAYGQTGAGIAGLIQQR